MKASRLLGASAALAGAVLAWHAFKPFKDDSAHAMGSQVPLPVQAASSQPAAAWIETAKPGVLTGQAPQSASDTVAAPSIDAVLREGLQSTNYRQFIHQVLAQPSPAGIRVGLELVSLCGLISQIAKDIPKLKIPATLDAEWQRRKKACEASGGIDLQQIRALSASKKRNFETDEAFLAYRSIKGTESELATFHRLGDAGGIASWGLIAERDNLAWFAAGDPLLIAHASGATSAAWQAVVCQRFGCDDFNARMVRCRDDASCQMSLQDILKESSGVDDATWQQLLAAARRRLDALLPA